MQHIHAKDQKITGFNKFLQYVWPIHRHEVKKLFPMFCLYFLISFVYHILRCMKVTLVVNSGTTGVTAIPFLKVWAVLPAAIFFTYLYSKLSSKYHRNQVFTRIICLFVGFFVFYLLMYPHKSAFKLSGISAQLLEILPIGFKGCIGMIEHWMDSIFYVMAEMWSIIVLSVLFWGFTNEVTKVEEARRFYSLIGLGANCAGIFSGEAIKILTFSHKYDFIPYGVTAWDQTVFILLSLAIICSLLLIYIFNWLNKHVIKQEISDMNDSLARDSEEVAEQLLTKKDTPETITLKDSFIYLLRSPYCLLLTLIVISYNMVANFADIIWTHQLHLRFPNDPGGLNSYMAHLDVLVGITSVIFSILVFNNAYRFLGWAKTSMLVPLIWLVTSSLLFVCLFFENSHLSMAVYGVIFSPINELILLAGTLQMCFGRTSKYTIFDQTKEIAYIPLGIQEKRKAKSIIDGIASRFGKSGSSIILQVLLLCCAGEMVKVIPIASVIIIISLLVWLISIRGVDKLMARELPMDIDISKKVQEKDIEALSAT